MNWNKIKNDYPAAWTQMMIWLKPFIHPAFGVSETEIRSDGLYISRRMNDDLMLECERVNTRDLYDFFDEKGIYVTIGFEVFEKNLFTWLIENEEETILASGQESPFGNRTEAEAAAFERAFSILNNQHSREAAKALAEFVFTDWLNSIAQPGDILTVKETKQ